MECECYICRAVREYERATEENPGTGPTPLLRALVDLMTIDERFTLGIIIAAMQVQRNAKRLQAQLN